MYKLLFLWKYFCSCYIVFVLIVSVMLGVVILIVVNSVMVGFIMEMRKWFYGIFFDIELVSLGMGEIYEIEEVMECICEVVGEDFEGVFVIVCLFVMIYIDYNGCMLIY